MTISDLFKIACLITASQFLLFAIFLLTHKKGKKLSNRILAVLLLSKFFGIVNTIVSVVFVKFFYINFPHLFYIGFSFLFLLGPSFYFYTKSLAFQDFSLNKKDVFHLLPFTIHSVYLIFNFLIYNAEVKRNILEAGIIHDSTTGMFCIVSFHLLILIYLVASLRIMAKYQNRLKEEYSNIGRINLSWLRFLLFGFCVVWLLDVTLFVMSIATDPYPYQLSVIVLGLLFIYANTIVFFGLRQPELFNGVKEKARYKNSNLTGARTDQYKTKLLEFMKKEKPYLNPDLNIQELATELSVPARHLSQVINVSLKQNFFDFISDYRITEAKGLLSDPSKKDETILDILYEVGFNSKSSFNALFKKKTGMTPSELRKVSIKANQASPGRNLSSLQ